MLGNNHCIRLKVVFILSILWLVAGASDYYGCIGSATECGQRVQLFSGESITLEYKYNADSPISYQWEERIIIVRQTRESYDVCSGCTLSVKFVDFLDPMPLAVKLSEANYSSNSYITSETLRLTTLAVIGQGYQSPATVNTTGTVLELSFDGVYRYNGNLKMVVTANVPQSRINVGFVLALSVPLFLLFIVFNVAAYKVRQRRVARMRAVLEARVTALVLEAAAREINASRAPHSPDAADSVEPPSYTEATGPPKYEEVVGDTQSDESSTTETAIDSCGPDNGSDTDLLVV